MKYLSIKTLFKITLISVSLCFEGLYNICKFVNLPILRPAATPTPPPPPSNACFMAAPYFN